MTTIPRTDDVDGNAVYRLLRSADTWPADRAQVHKPTWLERLLEWILRKLP